MKQEIPYSSAQLLYYAWQLSRNRGGADDDKLTGVLSEARVDLNPHQVMAAFLHSNLLSPKVLSLPMRWDWEKQ